MTDLNLLPQTPTQYGYVGRTVIEELSLLPIGSTIWAHPLPNQMTRASGAYDINVIEFPLSFAALTPGTAINIRQPSLLERLFWFLRSNLSSK